MAFQIQTYAHFIQLKWSNLLRALNDSVISASSIFCLVFGALIFGRSLAELGLPQSIAAFTVSMSLTPIFFLLRAYP